MPKRSSKDIPTDTGNTRTANQGETLNVLAEEARRRWRRLNNSDSNSESGSESELEAKRRVLDHGEEKLKEFRQKSLEHKKSVLNSEMQKINSIFEAWNDYGNKMLDSANILEAGLRDLDKIPGDPDIKHSTRNYLIQSVKEAYERNLSLYDKAVNASDQRLRNFMRDVNTKNEKIEGHNEYYGDTIELFSPIVNKLSPLPPSDIIFKEFTWDSTDTNS